MAMMICMFFGGGGGGACVVSVLCGAGGGLTVHAATTDTAIDAVSNAPATARTRRGNVGTPIRV
jgi:hypothetical protein